ncbi:DUF2497 domain-containing protein [Hoeflea sp. CAU 1731]
MTDEEEESPTLARVRDEVANTQATRTTAMKAPSTPPRDASDNRFDRNPPRSDSPPPQDEKARYKPAGQGATSATRPQVSLAEVAARAGTFQPSASAKPDPQSFAAPKAPEKLDAPVTRTMPEKPAPDRFAASKPADKLTVGDALRSNALVSSETGDRVAASFEHLNQAVVTGPTKSFDEIAQEMLQPMLREWLDNNLPVLVERLVREEIERIAKGR